MMLPVQLTGTFARSQNLIRATRDFDRGRTSHSELEKVRREDVKRLIELQAGFEYVIDGNLLWQDLFRPFSEAEGIELGPLTRFFETNTFFRRPIITGKIHLPPEKIGQYFYFDLMPDNRKVILPGPVTFWAMSENRYYKKDFLFDLAHTLNQILRYLYQQGVKTIQFSEPYLAYNGKNLKKKDWTQAKTTYQIISQMRNNMEIGIATYFGDFSEITQLLKFPIDFVTIDLTATSTKKLKIETDKKIGLGCIDATNSLLEVPKSVIKFVADLIKRFKLKRFFICPNCDLDFLPYSVAEKKVAILRKVAEQFKQY
ncbi:MAG: hypothetical protein ABIK67_00285 [candidate division WOR-3 bacterium]